MTTKPTVTITIGISNPRDAGASAYCARLQCGGHTKNVYGSSTNDTPNRMQLQATIAAVEAMKTPAAIVLKTTSGYVAQNYKHAKSWKSNGWLTTQGTPVKEVDLWKQLVSAVDQHGVDITAEKVDEDVVVDVKKTARAVAYCSGTGIVIK